ncbi:hypothetical protein [Acinetobacter sp. YH16052]|uniref:hypothetical protein n=1 Tax=Acinetobacter sp. YH16052 TaxID=2601191 RepID=UPI0015D2D77A|nr:hypothetical protein [Acinetobacter sp. YH16052]
MSFSAQLKTVNNKNHDIYQPAIQFFAQIYFDLKKDSDFSGLANNFIFADEESYPLILEDNGLRPTAGKVVGVAMHHMTSSDKVSHQLFFDISKIWGLIFLDEKNNDGFNINEEDRLFRLEHALNICVHELGHVHFNNVLLGFNSNMVLEKDFDTRNLYSRFHHSTKRACINEYLACLYASTRINFDQYETYRALKENVDIYFRGCPNDAEKAFNKFYETHHYGELMNGIYMPIAFLLKSSSYFLGHIHGLDQKFDETDLYEKLKTTWFIDYILKLEEILLSVYDKILNGEYDDSNLNHISPLLDDLARLFGIKATPTQEQDNVYVHIIK